MEEQRNDPDAISWMYDQLAEFDLRTDKDISIAAGKNPSYITKSFYAKRLNLTLCMAIVSDIIMRSSGRKAHAMADLEKAKKRKQGRKNAAKMRIAKKRKRGRPSVKEEIEDYE